MSNILKFLFKTITILLVVGIVFLACSVWFCFYDVIGLELYKDETISDIIPYYDNIYVITEDGYCYVLGGYHNSSSRKYRNSESHHNDKLNASSPVKIFSKKVLQVIPYGATSALLIDEENTLYDFNDFNIQEICSNVSYAVKATSSQGKRIFGSDNKSLYYVIDKTNVLYAVNENGESKELFSAVSAVDIYLEKILVLNNDGVLNQYQISEDGKIILTEKLFEDVSSFDVKDTSLRFDGEKFVFDDEVAKNMPLLNVLTNDGELYVKGAYNLLCCTRSLAAHPEPKIYNEWTLIAEQVESFSLAPMGTAIKHMDNTAGYYGFDTDNSANSSFEFGYLKLAQTNVVDVYASDVQVLIKTDQAFYTWGYSLEYDVSDSEHNLFNGTPIIVYP